ncbi:MAG: hydroxymethylglutaryl-CoA reductase (NADPH) [Acidobacteriota bacterium]
MNEALSTDLEDLAQEIAEGRRALHQLPPELDVAQQAGVRRRAAEIHAARLGDSELTLGNVAHFSLDAERASTQNCENFMGVAQIPMGLAGPLQVRGEEADGSFFVPLATTEGALIASINRGCRAIAKSGGAVVRVEDVGMTRAPVFRTRGIEETQRFLGWVSEHEDDIRKLAEQESRFLKLQDIRPAIVGSTVLLRFRFTTGDAMGMNMVTIACDRVVNLLEEKTGVECIALSGNYCVDKKPSAVNFQLGRGKRIFAEVVLDRGTLATTLKTNAEALAEVQYRKNFLGSISAGAMGYNAQYANVLAALFVACGQDLAHVVEGAMGVTCFEPREDGSVYASVTLPDAPVAAVGGGTGLGTQREALRALGIAADAERPGAAARKFAEIVGATVLAGELSLMSAFTSRDLARAHEQLGRSKEP